MSALLDYLLVVNDSASAAVSDVQHGRLLSLLPGALRKLDKAELFRVALPPLVRRKVRAVPVTDAPVPAARRGQIPAQLPPGSFQSDTLCLSCDGSAGDGRSGWGFTVAQPGAAELQDFCGPTILDTCHPSFVGASRHTHNVGELTAMLFALSWIAQHTGPGDVVILEYDSDFAAGAIQRRLRVKTNLALVLRARAVFDTVTAQIQWRKVESHTGLLLNERADRLADCGAFGIVLGGADVSRWTSAHPE